VTTTRERPLRVAVASIGRFHMFELTRELRRLGDDARLFTAYPSIKVDRDLRAIARTRPWWTLAGYLRARLPITPPDTWWAQRNLDDFGPWVARTLDPGEVDVLDALAGAGLEAGRRLHQHGRPWVCGRASTHILTQKALLEDEHRRWGVRPPDFSRGIERCLAEYDECDALIVPSTFVKRSFVERGVAADKVNVLPFGVDLSLFSPQPKADDRFRVIFVGAHSVRKGVGDLFDAVRPLVTAGRCEVWLVGQPTADAQRILRANADIFVEHGPQPRARLAWYYSQASVLLLPSIEEGLALVLLQAMACGVPVIASTNTGVEDVVDDGVEGFVVPPRDPARIRERLEWMLDNPRRRQEMGAAARRRVADVEGWNGFARSCREVYRRVMSDTAVR
jgi:starch synthase